VCAKRFMRSDHLNKHVKTHQQGEENQSSKIKKEPYSATANINQ
jgi:hypothetical protein